ncbi:MAG: hypothetical protein JEZ12_07755 [Desulfobacterium sp.]|nr:hypothetical protein [Desulfobacterium sp.]
MIEAQTTHSGAPWEKWSEGLEYRKSMELMGRYASANHDMIHQSVLNHPGAVSVLTLENHHNFAWKM